MRRHLSVVAVSLSFFLAGLGSVVAVGQSVEASKENVAPKLSPAQPKDFVQIVPYWTTEASWHSELQLKNNQLGRDLTVVPVLRTPDGAETTLRAVTIKPQEVKVLDIAAAAPQLGHTYGSVVLRQNSGGSHTLYA